MLRRVVISLIALVAGCGTGPAEDHEQRGLAVDQAECLRMGQATPAYPGTHSIDDDDLSQFQVNAAQFRQAYASDDIEFYRLESRPATISPYIMSEHSDAARGVMLGDAPLDEASATQALEGFLEEWKDFFDPYGATLTDGGATCDDRYCSVGPQQEICGLEVRQYENHFYNGNLNVTLHKTTGALMWVQSGLVPPVPLPAAAALTEEEVLAAVDGESHLSTCSGELLLSSNACVASVDGPFILIQEVGGVGDAETIEYRLAVNAEVRPDCNERSAVIVTLDAVDHSILTTRDKQGCDS